MFRDGITQEQMQDLAREFVRGLAADKKVRTVDYQAHIWRRMQAGLAIYEGKPAEDWLIEFIGTAVMFTRALMTVSPKSRTERRLAQECASMYATLVCITLIAIDVAPGIGLDPLDCGAYVLLRSLRDIPMRRHIDKAVTDDNEGQRELATFAVAGAVYANAKTAYLACGLERTASSGAAQ